MNIADQFNSRLDELKNAVKTIQSGPEQKILLNTLVSTGQYEKAAMLPGGAELVAKMVYQGPHTLKKLLKDVENKFFMDMPFYMNEKTKVMQIPGFGRGIIATQSLKRGEIILIEKAFCAGRDIGELMAQLALVSQIDEDRGREYDDLVPRNQELTGLAAAVDRAANNCIAPPPLAPVPGVITPILCGLKTAMLNHSCCPNVRYCSIGDVIIVHTLIDIRQGEQLFDKYAELSNNQYDVLSQYNFKCQCQICQKQQVRAEVLNKYNALLDQVRNTDQLVNIQNKDNQQQNETNILNPVTILDQLLQFAGFCAANEYPDPQPVASAASFVLQYVQKCKKDNPKQVALACTRACQVLWRYFGVDDQVLNCEKGNFTRNNFSTCPDALMALAPAPLFAAVAGESNAAQGLIQAARGYAQNVIIGLDYSDLYAKHAESYKVIQ